MGRIINYDDESALSQGDYFIIDNETTGTKRLSRDSLIDSGLGASGKVPSSAAVKQAIDEIRAIAVTIDPTLTQPGQAADAEAAGKVKNGLNTIIYGGDYDYPIVWIDGYYINNNNGEAEAYTNWMCTDFIEIPANTRIKTTTTATNGTGYNAFYSDNKSFLQKFTNANSALTIPNNAKYMRLSCRKTENVTVLFAMRSGMIDFNGCLAEQGDEW